MIYFDNNSTTRVFEHTVEAMRPYLTQRFANPASAIAQFAGITQTIQNEKMRLCQALNAESGSQFVVTSGATESNNLALIGATRANPKKRHIVISSIEHPSVMEVCEVLRAEGCRISIVPVTQDGIVNKQVLSNELTDETLLVSIMMANNETGVLQCLKSLAGSVKEQNPSVLFHTDATQAVGKLPIDLSGDLADVDMLSLSAHKFHGPKGTGALFVRDPDMLTPILHGGGQQQGRRAGTENPAGLVGMVTALISLLGVAPTLSRVKDLRTRLEAGILKISSRAFVLGASAKRLPTTSNVCLPGIDAEELVDRLASRDIAISAGSACAYGARKPSYVALAHGLSYEQAKSCVRVSLSVESTEQEVDFFLHVFSEILADADPKVGTA